MVTCGHLTTKLLMRFAPISVFHFLFVTAQGYVGLQRWTVRCPRIKNCKGSGCRITITSVYLTSPYRLSCQLFTTHYWSNYDKKWRDINTDYKARLIFKEPCPLNRISRDVLKFLPNGCWKRKGNAMKVCHQIFEN